MNRWDGKKTKWVGLVNHRCIVIKDSYWESSYEVLVIETSPSGKYVKFKYPSEHENWERCNEYLLIEDLGATKEV